MAAKQTVAIVLATIFALILCSSLATAQAPVGAPEPSVAGLGPSAASPAPAPDCMTNLFNLSDCLTYVEAGSNLTKPDKACCPELAGLVESSPQCLCYLFDKNATSGYGINIDMKRALGLPKVCGVSTPPASLCSAIIGAPVEGPAGSEVSSPGPAPEGLAASPSSGGGNTNGAASNIAISGLVLLAALAIATLFGI